MLGQGTLTEYGALPEGWGTWALKTQLCYKLPLGTEEQHFVLDVCHNHIVPSALDCGQTIVFCPQTCSFAL